MGQKVSPIGFRIGITRDWVSRWFAPKSNFGEFLVEDWKIRNFVENRLNRQPPYAGISSIEIERTREEVKVTLRTARPGLVIGPRGAEVEKLKEALEDLSNRRVNVNVMEIAKPDLDAQLAAGAVAEQLKRRTSFRRAIKQRCEMIMQAGAKGVKIQVAGRLGGAEMSRRVKQITGSIPLHTLDADVDYGFVPCFTTYGALGVKVWIYRGKFGETDQPAEAAGHRPAGRPAQRRPRREPSGAGASPTGSSRTRSGSGASTRRSGKSGPRRGGSSKPARSTAGPTEQAEKQTDSPKEQGPSGEASNPDTPGSEGQEE